MHIHVYKICECIYIYAYIIYLYWLLLLHSHDLGGTKCNVLISLKFNSTHELSFLLGDRTLF